MELLDTNQVNFRGQLPKIMTHSNLWRSWGPFWNCMWPARTVFTFQRQSGICRCTKGSRHVPANIKGVLCCTFGQGRDFSFKDSSRERVSYLKGCLSNSLDAASPSFELQSPCKCTQKGGKNPPHNIMKKQIGNQLLLAGRGNFRLPQRGAREDGNRRQKI